MSSREFTVKHGLIVNNNVLVANTTTANVGIGTANPAYKLDVAGAVNAASLLVNGAPLSFDLSPAFNQANSAYTKANNALANTSGTFAGNLKLTGSLTTDVVVGSWSALQMSSAASARSLNPAQNAWFPFTASAFGVTSTGIFGFSPTTNPEDASDVKLYRDGVGLLAQRVTGPASSANQSFRIYNTYTDPSNYERGILSWSSTANTFTIGTEAAGTGTARNLQLIVGGTTVLSTLSTGQVSFVTTRQDTGSAPDILLGGRTGTGISGYSGYDVVTLNAAGSYYLYIRAGAPVHFPQYSIALGPIGGTIASLYGTGTNIIGLGGTTSSFPALKRSNTTLQVRLADDSAFANLEARVINAAAVLVNGLPITTGGDYAYSNNTANSANAYAVTVGAAANSYMLAVANTKQAQENGFLNRNQTSLTFNNTLKTINIAPTSGVFTYFQNSANYTVSTTQSIYIANTEGLHFVYFDGATLKETTNFVPELITTYAITAAVYWDTSQNTAILFADERHGSVMDSQTHLYNHKTFGARYGSGLALNTITAGGSGNANTSAQFGVDGGEIWDEDIQITIANSASQILTAPAQIPLYYKLGASGVWRKLAATTFPMTTTGSGRAAYNLNTAGTWSLSEATNNYYVLMHYFATGDMVNPIIGIIGQTQYSSLALAQAGATTELQSINLSGISSLTPEYVPIATVIFQTVNAYTNGVKSRIVATGAGAAYVDWRTSKGGGAGSSSSLVAWGDIGGTITNQADLVITLSDTANIANSYSVTVGAASNTWANNVGTAGNNYTNAVGAAANNYANTTFLKISGNQTFTGGFSYTSFNAGSNVAAYGTWTPNPANGNHQYANSNGAFTLAAPASDCELSILLYNGLGGAGSGAGSITFSGFTVGSATGDAYTTTANNKYILSIKRINSVSTYVWKALQ